MRLTRTGCVIAGALLVAAPRAAAQEGERLTDRDVKQLIENVDHARDRFEDQLDGQVKNEVLRNATGEIRVKSALDDLQQDMSKLKSRFTSGYAASAEVEAVLRRGGVFDGIMKEQPAGIKGADEWDRLAAGLRRLGAVYHAGFPLAEGAPVRRINDAEAAGAAAAVASQADRIKHAVGDDKTLAKADKQALLAEVSTFGKQAKALQSRLKDGKPATAQARALREGAAALAAAGRPLPPPVLAAIGELRAPLATLDQAFGVAQHDDHHPA
jgi:hypothetical protein